MGAHINASAGWKIAKKVGRVKAKARRFDLGLKSATYAKAMGQ